MSDWKANRYQPLKTWAEIQQERTDAMLERSMPKRWWHDIVFGWGGVALLIALPASILWVLFSLFSR
ncbi:hypothetical protein [Pseudoxanthomonas sp. X-1]|uniref:hypothetical protein n=1 Tax=Pseudoxanthomonas sp. X-1 TaxID=2571115 RepID=UPI00110BD211|nr:hypothetical protein [Pseudoxanthomonas sp. X-1]TMN18464.1 hypothetical protein FF950_14365 [Pseudoxanthomonas sp. X-1]UAY76035.1 hypothetical protein LAJ50_07310 [Pseudoxanthomonas sp. X-1]